MAFLIAIGRQNPRTCRGNCLMESVPSCSCGDVLSSMSRRTCVGKGGEAVRSSVVCVSIRGFKEEQNILRLGRLVQAVQEGRVKCCDARLQ